MNKIILLSGLFAVLGAVLVFVLIVFVEDEKQGEESASVVIPENTMTKEPGNIERVALSEDSRAIIIFREGGIEDIYTIEKWQDWAKKNFGRIQIIAEDWSYPNIVRIRNIAQFDAEDFVSFSDVSLSPQKDKILFILKNKEKEPFRIAGILSPQPEVSVMIYPRHYQYSVDNFDGLLEKSRNEWDSRQLPLTRITLAKDFVWSREDLAYVLLSTPTEGGFAWSPSGTFIAFSNTARLSGGDPHADTLIVADASTGQSIFRIHEEEIIGEASFRYKENLKGDASYRRSANFRDMEWSDDETQLFFKTNSNPFDPSASYAKWRVDMGTQKWELIEIGIDIDWLAEVLACEDTKDPSGCRETAQSLFMFKEAIADDVVVSDNKLLSLFGESFDHPGILIGEPVRAGASLVIMFHTRISDSVTSAFLIWKDNQEIWRGSFHYDLTQAADQGIYENYRRY
ncbi:hypothetical protein IID24_04425 [Patescibacteria group bacterium]|nr:hypothetical protein [Patescibacteria group bacterium]